MVGVGFAMRRYFSFQGRLNRAKYWAVVGIVMAFFFVTIVFLDAGAIALVPVLPAGIAAAVLIPGYLVCAWISLAASAKRLHDRNKSAWWLLIFCFLPSVFQFAATGFGNNPYQGVYWVIGGVLNLAGICISIWGIVELGILEGTEGENRYGLDPLASGLARVFD